MFSHSFIGYYNATTNLYTYPLYNCEKYIQFCVDSILAQTIGSENFEIIVVEDCSTDNSFEVVKNNYSSLKNVKLIKNEKNLGPGQSRNIALQNATGKWISTIDADDFLDNTFFEAMIDAANRFYPDIISMGYKEVIYNNNRWQINKIFNVTDKIIQLTSDKKLRMQNMCEKKFIANLWCKLIKNELFKKYDIKSPALQNEDILFHFQLLYYTEKYILLPDNLYNFRQTPLSITRRISATKPRKMLNQYIVLFDYLDGYIKNMPEISKDLRLKKAIYDFFNFVYLDACFLKGCNGHTMENIYAMMLPLLEEHFGNKAYMLMYLIEEYMKTRSLNAKK